MPEPSARRFDRAAGFGNATIRACRFGRATSHVREQTSHSYSCRSCTGSRARILDDWQNGQEVNPGMITLRGSWEETQQSFSSGGGTQAHPLVEFPGLMEGLSRDVRVYIYNQIVATSVAPSTAETATALGRPVEEIEAAYHALAAARSIVLRPATTTIWMAMPFSNSPTSFTVIAKGRAYYANCAWDAFGIPALLDADARIFTTCGDCGGALERKVSGGGVGEKRGVVHFAIPARRWWDDVGFT